MKAHVIISGEMRTFAKGCAHSQKWHVLRRFSDVAFYVAAVDDERAGDAELLKTLFPGSPLHIESNKQPELPEPLEPMRFEPYARSVSVQAVLRQLWQNEQGYRLFKKHAETGREPECVIRLRPDLFFHCCEFEAEMAKTPLLCLTPWWGKFGGVNDRFAIMGTAAADHYFTAYSKLDRLLARGCPLHPESLVMASLEDGGCYVSKSLRTEFSTLRIDGSARQPEITAWDIAHAALSG